MKPLYARSLLFILALFCSVSVATHAHAQQATTLSVSPVTFELSANPGDVITNQIKVTNVSAVGLTMETRVENIAGTGAQGQVQLTEDETQFALSSWVSTNPKQFTLKANESRTIDFTITVPKNAEPGGHYGSVLVGTIAGDNLDSTGAAIAQRIGSLLLVRVSGQAKEEATIKTFEPKLYLGAIEELLGSDGKTKILVPKEESADTKARSYFSNGPIVFNSTFTNTGNVHVKPTGQVIVYNLFNKQVANLVLDSRNVFPGNSREMSVVWPEKKLWGIHYRAQLSTVYGSTNQPLVRDISFWAFPLPVAITVGVVLLIILFLRKRLGRALRILFRGA